MAALLVALSVMSVLMTVVMPVWKQAGQREKEAELIFRGQQYARAIGLFQRRAGPGALPPNLDVLVQQRFLRKKYKDPITNDEFQLLTAGTGPGAAGGAGAPGAAPGSGAPGAGAGAGRGGGGAPGQSPGGAGFGVTGAVGGIQGVVSKSKAKSIRVYNGRQAYNEWTFLFVAQQQAAGGRGDGGGRGRGPGQRGSDMPGRGTNASGRGGFGAPPSGGGFPPAPGARPVAPAGPGGGAAPRSAPPSR